ncbi:hypothetical protein EI555_009756, partial [Monodon monoceros]
AVAHGGSSGHERARGPARPPLEPAAPAQASATAPPPPAPPPRRPAPAAAAAAAMGVQGFQDYIEKHCPSAVVPWNHMLGYLAALAKACFGGNIELFVFFNGALEKARLHEWVKRQGNERQTAQQIVSHVQNKGTPPPKVWFLPPVCMAHCIRLALIRFHVK